MKEGSRLTVEGLCGVERDECTSDTGEKVERRRLGGRNGREEE